MALNSIVGDPSADSFVSLAEYHAYILQMYGVDLSTNDVVKDEAKLRQSADVMNNSYKWYGYRASTTQSMPFPRVMTQFVDGVQVPDDSIPKNLKSAQCELAYQLEKGIDIAPTIEGGTVKMKKVEAGPAKVTTEYDSVFGLARNTRVENLLKPYHDGSGSSEGGSVEVIRG
jgi:hypothetical protein